MPTTTHSSPSGTRRSITALVLLVSVAAGALAGKSAFPTTSSAAAGPREARQPRTYSYGWPIKPFDRQHPIRAYFGDPRSVFFAPATERGLMTGRCACSFHQGVDISAPDGTAVYPVRSGVVRIVTREWVQVDSDGGVAFQYWHIDALVKVGDHVTEHETVLGHTQKPLQHVHLTQLQDGRPVNPLADGNLGPYEDRTAPRVNRIAFRGGDVGPDLLPESLHGRIEILADASDTAAMAVPGEWANLPVSPAAVSFRIVELPSRKVAVETTTARNVALHLPRSPDLWSAYARGTRMNMVQFGQHRAWYQRGVYLFKLTKEPFDTHALADGVYELTVTASDTAGNRGSATQIFSVHNRHPW